MAWHEAGAVVAVSDARRMDGLFPGWHALRIDSERIGQARTFAHGQRRLDDSKDGVKQQPPEWLKLNRPPAWRPGVKQGLFEATP
jgi:hypothetical protein